MTDRELEPNVPFETGLVRSEARFPGVSLHKDNQLSQGPSGSQLLEEVDMGGLSTGHIQRHRDGPSNHPGLGSHDQSSSRQPDEVSVPTSPPHLDGLCSSRRQDPGIRHHGPGDGRAQKGLSTLKYSAGPAASW